MFDKLILQVNPNAELVCAKYKVSLEDVALAIANAQNLKAIFKFNANTVTKFYKELLPDRLCNQRPRAWLLDRFDLKLCTKCANIKPKTDFRLNKSTKSGVNSFCKECHTDTTGKTQPARQAAYRARKAERTPLWADLNKIKEFYDNCPEGMTVDHIIPLHGVSVCGLHVEDNLQYLSGSDNSKKNNKFILA